MQRKRCVAQLRPGFLIVAQSLGAPRSRDRYNTSAVNYWKWLLSVPHSPAPVSRDANLLPLYTLVAGRDPPAAALGATFAAATRYYMCMQTNQNDTEVCAPAAE